MVRDGIPFVTVPLLIALALAYFGFWAFAAVFLALAAFMAFFFRNPDRVTPDGPNLVISAADGRVTRIEETAEGKLVSVFLSPLDVHVNRAPISGTVTNVRMFKGKKRPATSNEASATNERNAVTIEGEEMTVVCTQIVGILARRIVCRCKPGDHLERGQLYGLIKFGSRTDLLMPGNVDVCVKVGEKVKGGETIIAKLPAA
jgi:phosphatidylserine decarboxylase